MELASLKDKIKKFSEKYKYVALILLVGLIFMLIPSRQQEQVPQTEITSATGQSEEERLEEILMQIEGAGEVRVMLTLATGSETIYQTDEDSSISSDTTSNRRDTVTVTDSQRVQNGLVRQVNPPVYLGAVVVCQGADSAIVKLAIIDAVSKVTNLGADQISVLKMK